jgi:hypothetical protein
MVHVLGLEAITDPVKRAQRLMGELYMITNLNPSEADAIFGEEQKTGSYVYLSSLFDASLVLQENRGPDPDFENVHSGPLTISFYSADDPESMKRWRRNDAINRLIYGAEKPDEIYQEGKRRITSSKHPEDHPPEAPGGQ